MKELKTIAACGLVQQRAEMQGGLSGVKVGLKYSHFGMFFMSVWTWGGEVVLFKDKTYEPIVISQDKAKAKYGTPLTYKFPPLLIIVLGGGAFWMFGVFGSGGGKSAAQRKAEKRSGGRSHMPSPGGARGGTSRPGTKRPAAKKIAKEYSVDELQQLYEDPRYQQALQLLEETNSFIKPVEYLVANGIAETDAGSSLAALKKAIAEAED
jgi:hypothetical protein